LVLVGLSLVPAAFVIRKLRRAHAFFYGGTTGFWHDTVLGTLNASLYEQDNPGPLVSWLGGLVVLLTTIAIAVSVRSVRRRSDARDLYLPALVFLVTSCALASVVQHQLLGVLYLWSRTGTYLLVLTAFILVVLAGRLSRTSSPWRYVLPAAAAAATANLVSSLNLTSVLEWKETADVKRMLADGAARRTDPTADIRPCWDRPDLEARSTSTGWWIASPGSTSRTGE
jgi:hypothetical protein